LSVDKELKTAPFEIRKSTMALDRAKCKQVIAELLIANGADVYAKVVSGSYKGMTPLDLTSKAEIADLTRKLGGRKWE